VKYLILIFTYIAFVSQSCSNNTSTDDQTYNAKFIELDGSSTVFPIAQEIVNSYHAFNPDIKMSLSLSGTSNGFMKFCQGQLEINNASRPIENDEIEMCKRNGVEFLELKIGFDAIVLAVNPTNTWCNQLDIEQLKNIWNTEREIRWSELDPNWPKAKITFFCPGRLSGTADVFTKILFQGNNGYMKKSVTSEDHNDIVMSISRDTFSIGFFSLPYLHSNLSFVKPLSIDDLDSTNGTGFISPTFDAIESHSYNPFQRPLFLYINKKILSSEAHYDFLRYFLVSSREIGRNVGYAPFDKNSMNYELAKLEKAWKEQQPRAGKGD